MRRIAVISEIGARADDDSGQQLPPEPGLQTSDPLPIVSLSTNDRPAAAMSGRRSSVVQQLDSTAFAKDSGSSAIKTFLPCSSPSPAHPEVVETMARSQASDSSTFRVRSGGDLCRHDDNVRRSIERTDVADKSVQFDVRVIWIACSIVVFGIRARDRDEPGVRAAAP